MGAWHSGKGVSGGMPCGGRLLSTAFTELRVAAHSALRKQRVLEHKMEVLVLQNKLQVKEAKEAAAQEAMQSFGKQKAHSQGRLGTSHGVRHAASPRARRSPHAARSPRHPVKLRQKAMAVKAMVHLRNAAQGTSPRPQEAHAPLYGGSPAASYDFSFNASMLSPRVAVPSSPLSCGSSDGSDDPFDAINRGLCRRTFT